MTSLVELHCTRDVQLLNDIEIQNYRARIHADWHVSADRKSINREFTLTDYEDTLALVNAIGVIAIRQDHHPDVCFAYRNCKVTYTTHSVGGLSLNDFICAARIDDVRQA